MRVGRQLAGLLCVFHVTAVAAATPSMDELLTYLHIDKAERENLLRGKILSTEVAEGSEKELAVGVVMFMPAPVEKLVDFVRSGKMFATDHDVIAVGELKDSADAADFTGIVFAPEQAKEAASLLEVGPGTRFNLSGEEIETFRALKKVVKDKNAIPAAATQAYQHLLLQRYRAYRQGGLPAIAPYDRGGGRVSRPGDELLKALQESLLLAEHFPEIHQIIRDYPQRQPKDVIHRFFWMNQNVENRPTFMLTHRLSVIRPEGTLMAERQFYVGHSYNSLFVLAGCLPMEGGTVVLYSNHTSTDQVAGFGSALRHSIGRSQMRDEIVKNFEQIRRELQNK